mmetsp:Transcript_19896/g.19915  ORF Transcript_19896/g.19915 Transcript_19896/m.19915 type:complete len:224 (-) Transcript_19896:14-685(-)
MKLEFPEKQEINQIDSQTPHFIGKLNDKLSNFLSSIGLEKYITQFKMNQISMEDLPYLTKEDFQDLGLPIGPRNRLIKFLNEQKGENQEIKENEDWNEIEEKGEYEEEMEEKELEDKEMSLKEFEEVILKISEQQIGMMEAIEENQRAIVKLAGSIAQDTESNASEVMSSRLSSYESFDRSKSPSRFAQPTLSSMAKQKVIPNKYMKVSPLRQAYALKYLNSQ